MMTAHQNPAFSAWLGATEMPWPTASCRRFNCIKNGGTPASQTPEFWGGEIMWLTPDDLGEVAGKSIGGSQRTITEEAIASSNAAIVPAGSLIVSTRAPIGHVGIASRETAFNQGCRAIVPESAKYDSAYLYYYTEACRPILQASGNGTTFRELSWEDLASLPLPLIPLRRQVAIAAFLDHETGRIDALVNKKHQLLDLIEEKRLAVITHAVTKGFDADVPMKDSAIQWLGNIPAHWTPKRQKFVSPKITVGIVVTPAAYYVDEGVPAIRGFNVRERLVDLNDLAFISPEANELHAKSKIFEGDLIAVRTGHPGTTAVVPTSLNGANCVDLIIIRKPTEADSRFLAYFANSDPAKAQYGAGAEGALQQHFNIETAKNLVIPLPPIAEQERIVKYLEDYEAELTKVSSKVEAAIDVLLEYRSALITNAVTGKIDVRDFSEKGAAA